jgi:hypothetical protein
MKWIAISGTWRNMTSEIKRDIRNEIEAIAQSGNGILTCGAPGADFVGVQAMLTFDPTAARIRIMLPSALESHLAYYEAAAHAGEISTEAAITLRTQLESLKTAHPESIIEGAETSLGKAAFFAATARMIDTADELAAFCVSGNEGTQDAIDNARAKGIPVKTFSYDA